MEKKASKTMPARPKRPEHITRGDVFDDLGFSPKKAASLKLKVDLHEKIMSRAKRYSQAQLAVLLHEPQSRVSDLMRGKLGKFSLEMLVFYGGQLGIHAQEVRTTQTRMPPPEQVAGAR